MRTTIEFDADTTKAIEQLRRERGTGVSDVVNELIRRGLMAEAPTMRYEPIRRELGLKIDVSNVADALDLLDGPESR
jgi:hypothetical protein